MRRRERPANLVERLQVRRRIRSSRPRQRRLVEKDNLGDVTAHDQFVVRSGTSGLTADALSQRRVKRLLDQGALARAADAGHDAENAERKRHVDRFEVVAARPLHRHELALISFGGDPAQSTRLRPERIVSRGRAFGLRQAGNRTAVEDFTACRTGARAQVHDVVGASDHVVIVLDDHEGVSLVASRCKSSIKRPTSCGCSPDVGSSRT